MPSSDRSPLPTGGAALRASDAERERVSELLREHAAAGRLELDELGQRLERAYSARTLGELRALLADLPGRVPPGARPQRAGKLLGLRSHAGAFLWVNLGLIGVWAATGAGYFWPMWPLLGWGIGLFSHGHGCGVWHRRRRGVAI